MLSEINSKVNKDLFASIIVKDIAVVRPKNKILYHFYVVKDFSFLILRQ